MLGHLLTALIEIPLFFIVVSGVTAMIQEYRKGNNEN